MDAKWISPPPVYGKASLYNFTKKFTADCKPKSFLVRISAETRYRLYINGKEICHGPCKSTKFVKHYEELDCAYALKEGINEIKAVVLHISPQEGHRFSTTCPRDRAALYFDGTVVTDKGEEKIVSDESFSITRAKHISYTWRDKCMVTIAPFEIIDGNEEYEKVDLEVLYTPDTQRGHYNSWGVKEQYMLEKRPIQLLDLNEKVPVEAVREYYDENGNYNIVLDPKYYTTAMVRYEWKAPKGTKMDIIYTECPLTEAPDGTLYKDMRDNADGAIIYGDWDNGDHYETFTASGDSQEHDIFFFRTFRFIRVECTKKPEYFRMYAARYNYDFTKDAIAGGIGSFICSDDKYSKMWDISLNTLECCTHETFADCPFYEDQQYIGDARFESKYAWAISNDSLMQKKVIIDTLGSLQPDGMIASTSPNMWVQVLHMSSVYFIEHIRAYLRFTGDIDFVKSIVGAVGFCVSYFEGWKTPEGIINPTDGCRFIDWVTEWNRGLPPNGEKAPLAIYNIMYASALKDAIEICEECGYTGLASDYRRLHADLTKAINRHFFDSEKGLYVDVLGYKTYCEHTGVWAILSDTVTGDDALTLAKKMMTEDGVAKSSFSKIYDLLRALDKVGLYDEYAPELLSQWDNMIEKHCTTWGESASFSRSECHGWSCTPVYEMTAMILGVKPLKDGYEKIRVEPHLMGLTHAKGRVPTGYGYVDVSWKTNGDKFSLDIKSSKEVEMEIVLPSGRTESVIAKEYSAEE